MWKRRDECPGRTRAKRTLLIAACAVSVILSALCRFVLPGVRFSAMLFLGSAALCVGLFLLELWAERSKAGRLFQKIVWTGLAVFLTVFLAVEGILLATGEQAPSGDPAAVIVLGAGVNGRTPSLTLQTRIEAAAAYLEEHPDTVAVLSGGQGPGEAITEAQAMRIALAGLGIPEERLLLEEKSTSTVENIAFSLEILQENGVDTAGGVGIVTNDFHLFRALRIAEGNGVNAVGIPAELPWWWLSANYYVREFFALGKMWLTGFGA